MIPLAHSELDLKNEQKDAKVLVRSSAPNHYTVLVVFMFGLSHTQAVES